MPELLSVRPALAQSPWGNPLDADNKAAGRKQKGRGSMNRLTKAIAPAQLPVRGKGREERGWGMHINLAIV